MGRCPTTKDDLPRPLQQSRSNNNDKTKHKTLEKARQIWKRGYQYALISSQLEAMLRCRQFAFLPS